MSTMVDLIQLIEGDIPDGRNHLKDSCGNLEKVASYCEGNYAQAVEKRHALEETKNYTTQSLASVAYQINTLATNFLHLLDLQTNQLAEMESSINHLSQTVMIHKEKVARREIGVLTTNKSTTRPQGVKNGIIYPAQVERPIKYIRKPIDYTMLDEIGHGVKTQQNKPRSHSVSSSRSSPGQAPTTRPPTPPQQARISNYPRNSPYRSPAPPVSPPSVPSQYAPGHVAQQNPYASQQKSQYAAQGHYATHQQQPTKSQYAATQAQQAPPSHYASQSKPTQQAPPQQSHYSTQQTAMQQQQAQQSHYRYTDHVTVA